MQQIEKTLDELNRVAARYTTLKSLFSQFQQSIEKASKSFPVKGIALTTVTATKSEVEFLDRRYTISFSVADGHGAIEFTRMKEPPANSEPTRLALVRFNGEGVLDIKQPASEDPMNLKEESCCLNLLVHWLLQDAPA